MNFDLSGPSQLSMYDKASVLTVDPDWQTQNLNLMVDPDCELN